MMELKRYKNIVLILLIALLASLLFYIKIARLSSASRAASINERISAINLEEQLRNIENQNDVIDDNRLNIRGPLAELQKYKVPDNYRQLMVEKNIFNLEKKEELVETEVEELPVKEPENENNDDFPAVIEEPVEEIQLIPEVPNPFYLHAVSINVFDQRAIIVNKNSAMTYLIKPGDIVDGYLVKKIDYQQVIMEKDGKEIVVVFRN